MRTEKRKENASDFALYLFHEGTNYRAYRFFGAHFCDSGVVFRVWAPNAQTVSVVGDFNGWDAEVHPMYKVNDFGVWEIFIENLSEYDAYKYAVLKPNGETVLKCDPYGFHAETRPNNASKLYRIDGYRWSDEKWFKYLQKVDQYRAPMNIYELHFGSWKQHENGDFYSYRQLADELIPYVKSMGYTHIELMPLTEYPFDGSWGYQVTGYFSATSRYGVPKDLMYFVDQCHQNGIGVFVDWVPAHFPKDAHGLYEFDGTCQYEYADQLKREHPDWGTRIFDFGKNEVRSFLISSAMFWLEYFHVDGIRVDAVASMLYLDYGKSGGEWRANQYGGHENLEAIEFLRTLNSAVLREYPQALMMAEESTAWPLVTKPPEDGGLGFNFKWNMGWMNDSLRYFSVDPIFRKHHHHTFSFSMEYAFSENYVLPFSHDEVVHGKCSLIQKQPGDYQGKFASLRSMMGYMMLQPGKKLSFMGNEFGQFIEWDYHKGLDWLLLDYEEHRKFHAYVRALNEFYLTHSELWELDVNEQGFEWLIADDCDNNIISFVRRNASGSELMAVLNFAPVLRTDYRIGVPVKGKYTRIFTSNKPEFGGDETVVEQEVSSEAIAWSGRKQSVSVTIPPMSVTIFRVPKKRGKKGKTVC